MAHASAQAVLSALSLVAPGACLQFLLDHEIDVIGAVSTRELSKIICTAMRSFTEDDAERRGYASEIMRHFLDVLSAEAAVDTLGALGIDLGPSGEAALERLLERFPDEPALLRIAIRVAQGRNDSTRLETLLTRLGLADNTPGTVAFAYRLRQLTVSAAPATVRVALVSSYTIDSLAAYVDLACRTIGVVPELYVAPFNSWAPEIIDEASGLRRFAPDIVFLSVSIDDLVPQLMQHPSAEALKTSGDAALERILTVVESFTRWAEGTPLVIHSFYSAFTGPLGILESRELISRSGWLAGLNARLTEALRTLPACYLLDVAEAVTTGGGMLADNPKLRHIASMRLPPQSLRSVAETYVRYVAPLKGLTKKCVVLDLDNTIWGGLVGEDGKEGIRLGNSSPGSEFVEFQEFLSSLSARGLLLAINSKNNPDDALDVIRTHEAMVLRESAFSAIRINWKPKPENMIAIAEELNIGVDSLVFVDDNPDEREQMRQLLPEVLTVELPKDPALYRSTIEKLPQLQTLSRTSEDRTRTQQYQTARLRERTKLSANSIDEYLRSLEIEVKIATATKTVFPRVAQLFARTNQFNLTTHRYDVGEIQRFVDDPSLRLWTLTSKDRFGDHGLVAVTLVRVASASWDIDSFLMSCRVIGYGIESTLLAYVTEQARAAGATALVGEFIETKKNAPANNFYARHGFRAVRALGSVQRWKLSLTTVVPFPAWVKVDAHDA
ncbi:MAG: HAD-IIIC family phosphatase [Candidatus Eremiobacteraeota bacterium]|nr:HAD-IIIC family phosphatase [Candidatus Eremiobacteraeota bacterium]